MAIDEGRAKLNGIELPIQCILMNCKSTLSSFATPHYHDYIEILYILNGSFKLLAGNKIYSCSIGDMAVINSKEAHNVLPDGTDCKYIVVKFLPQILYTSEQTLFEIKYMLPFTLNNSAHPRVIKKAETENTDIPQIMEGMMQGVGETKRPIVYNIVGMWAVRIVGTFICTELFGLGLVAAWACMISHNLFLFVLFLICYKQGRWNPFRKVREA